MCQVIWWQVEGLTAANIHLDQQEEHFKKDLYNEARAAKASDSYIHVG